MLWKALVKLLLHGVLLSLIGLILGAVWVLATVFLVVLGFVIGLIIALGLLFLMAGFVNGVLGEYLWEIDRSKGIINTLVHGLALGIVLLIANLWTSYLPTLVFSGTSVQVVSFIITIAVDGAVGAALASSFGRNVAIPERGGGINEELPSVSDMESAPLEISEGLPVCPLCKKRTEWKAWYKFGRGLKGYRIVCNTCNAVWENVPNKPLILPRLSTPTPMHFSSTHYILVLRNQGNSRGVEGLLNRQIDLEAWRQMVGKFCSVCEAPLAEDETKCPKCGKTQ